MVLSASKVRKRKEKKLEKKRQMQKPRILGNRSFYLFFVRGGVPAVAILGKMNIKSMFQAKIAKECTGI